LGKQQGRYIGFLDKMEEDLQTAKSEMQGETRQMPEIHISIVACSLGRCLEEPRDA
jgi:hypothetical protein